MAAELLSGSPSPSRDQGVFGKELRLSGGRLVARQACCIHSELAETIILCLMACIFAESERQQLSSAGEIFLTKIVHVESRSKKGDGTEPRKLVSAVPSE